MRKQTQLTIVMLAACCLQFFPPCMASSSGSQIRGGQKAAAPDTARQKHDAKFFQSVVRRMGKEPKWAEQELKKLDFPSAKVYLAYLYFTKKVKIPNASKRVDQLMHEALNSDFEDGYALSEIDPKQNYHYKDLETLLQHLRFISEAERTDISVPSSIFQNYPLAAFNAFNSYWGSSRDGQMNIDFDPKTSIYNLAAVKKFDGLLSDMRGDSSPSNNGTLEYAYFRRQTVAMMKASMAPQIYFPGIKRNESEVDQRLDKFIRAWSNDELFNKVKYEAYLQAKNDAEKQLAKHYATRFGMDDEKAALCARTALQELATAYLSRYPESFVTEREGNPVYKLFSRSNLSLTEMQRGVTKLKLDESNLELALRLSILNGASPDVIKFLLKKGAPLNGTEESPLFSAVRRPEIISLLLKAGADPNEQNTLGKTALFQAAQYNSLASVNLLLKAGAIVSTKMKNPKDFEHEWDHPGYTVGERTPLMYACMFAGAPVIRCLLQHGANKKDQDTKNAYPADFLADNKVVSRSEIAKLKKLLY